MGSAALRDRDGAAQLLDATDGTMPPDSRFRLESQLGGRRGWTIVVPLIEQLKDGVWAAVLRLHG
jgi:hypothetical protein